MNREILRLALPNIITTLTVPLLGMVDLAIVGHMGSETYIGAIALGTMIFNMIYWNFGFLRMGTSGFTAQAFGADDREEAVHILSRALFIGLSAALLLIVFQLPIRWLVFRCVEGCPAVEAEAARYFHICIWAAPAILCLYGFKGWFIGMQNAKLPMWIAIFMDVVNIALSLFFVYVLKMKIAGVALGTVLAQYAGLGVALFCWWRHYRSYGAFFSWREALSRTKMRDFFRVNADIFLRTLCLIAVFTFIPAAGARMGDDYLSANTLLMQFFTLFTYVMDGFAYAGESLVGKYVGAQNRTLMQKAIRHLFGWGLALSVLFVLAYAVGGNALLHLFTDNGRVVEFARQYYVWVLLIPLVSFSAFLWDGILIGATASKMMRNTMFVSTLVFFAVFYSCRACWGNHALWLAFLCYLAFRGLLQSLFFHRALRKGDGLRFACIALFCCLFFSNASAQQTVTDRMLRKGKVVPGEVTRLKITSKSDTLGNYLLRFPQIEALDLSRLRLKTLPAELFQLENLRELDISRNKINYLPPELGQLVQLRRLVINRNNIAYLPATIGQLRHLELIDAWSTYITELPLEIKALDTVLKTIDLRVIQMDEWKQEQMQQLLPHTEILFSPSCGCGH